MFQKSLNLSVFSPCVSCIVNRFMCTVQNEPLANYIQKYFDISNEKTNTFVQSNRLLKFTTEELEDSINFCESIGFTREDLFDYPSLIRTNKITLHQHYKVFEEGGFTDLTPRVISKFRKHFNSSIWTLKKNNLIGKETSVVDKLLSYLDPQPSNFISNDLYDEDKLFSAIHMAIIKRYLGWRLEASEEEMEKFFRTYKMITSKSLAFLCENIKIAEELNFTPASRLLKFGYLLHNYPPYTKEVLETIPNLAGTDLRREMRTYPKLVMVSPRNYIKIFNILKKYNIPDETIQKTMNIFHLSPQTVEERLSSIHDIPEFRVHLHNPNILKIIIHYNRAKSRLTFLQEVKLKCSSLKVIGCDEKSFNNHIKEGKDINGHREVVAFVQNLLNSDTGYIKKRLKKHPFFCHVPLLNIEDTFKFLKDFGFKKDDLIRTVQILLYPKEKIEAALGRIKEDDRIDSKKLKSTQRLNLALYYMEKDHHFTGNGIWTHEHVY